MLETARVPATKLTPATPGWGGGRTLTLATSGWRTKLQMPAGTRGRYLLVAYGVLALIGVVNIVEQDLYGFALIAVAVIGVWQLNRRWFHPFVWTWQILLGLFGLIQLDFTSVFSVAFGIVGLAVGLSRPRPVQLGFVLPPPIEVQGDGLSAHAPTEHESAAAPATEPARLLIRTIGHLEIRVRGEDVTEQLIGKPMLSFVYLYLLSRAIQGANVRRAALSEEVSPGLPADQQRRRLRSTMHDLQRKLPADLADRVKLDGESVSFDLSGLELDVNWLRWYASAVGNKTLLEPDLERRLAGHLESMASGEFLPGWEDVEHKATGARGVAGGVINDIRRQVDELRCDLAVALARSYVAAGETGRAVQPLEWMLPIAADRDDLQRLLISVYRQAGQQAKASKLAAQLPALEEV